MIHSGFSRPERVVFLFFMIFGFMITGFLAAVPLNLAVPSMQEGLSKIEQWTPIVEYLEGECGFEIELLIVKDHEVLSRGLRDRFYDVGFVNALWEQRLTTGGQFLTRARVSIGGGEQFTTHIIVNKDSVIRKVSELGGEFLALTVQGESLGGYYIPLILCREAGVDLTEVFRQIVYSETFESILKGVAFGVVDAGAVTSDILYSAEMKDYRAEVRSVAISKPLPQWALVARDDNKTQQMDRFISELVGMSGEPGGRAVLVSAGFDGFTPREGGVTGIPAEYLDMIGEIDAFSR